MNDVIPDFMKRCSLPTFQSVVQWFLELGQSGYVAIMDLSNAWKQIRTDPADIWMLGWYFKGRYFVDVAASFGLAHVVRIFTILDECVEYGFRNRIPVGIKQSINHRSIMSYIDDYAVGARSKEHAAVLFKTLQDLCVGLGLQFNPVKNQPPTQTPLYLGFQYNLQHQTVEIPQSKVEDFLQETEQEAKRCRSIMSDKLERIAGVMAHLSEAFWSGRHLIQSAYRLFHYPHDRSKKSRSRKISGEFRRDLRKFRDLLRENVPVPLIQVRLIFSGNPIVVESDGCCYRVAMDAWRVA